MRHPFFYEKNDKLQPSRLPQQISYVMYMPNGTHL